jgi:hypothetical protein
VVCHPERAKRVEGPLAAVFALTMENPCVIT